jgi:hypothetical protein
MNSPGACVATERFEQQAFQDVSFTAKVDLLFALVRSVKILRGNVTWLISLQFQLYR